MASSGVNPFAATKEQLLASLAVAPPPASYQYRLIALMVLCGLFFILCIVQLALTLLDFRRRGKSFWIVRLQRLRAGRIAIFNTLVVYAVLNSICAVVLAVGRYRNYQVYYQGGSMHNLTILSTAAFHPSMLTALFYSHSNLSAVTSISRGRGIEVAGRVWVLLHNAILPFMLVIWFGSIIPLSVSANALINAFPSKLAALVALLTQAADEFTKTGSAGDLAAQVTSASADVIRTKATASLLTKAIVSVSSAYSIAVSLAAIGSLSFVLKLRKQSQANRSRTEGGSVWMTREERTVIEAPEHPEFELSPTFKKPTIGFTAEPSLPFSQSAIKTGGGNRTRSRAVENGEAAALTRLANDLSLSMPFILILGLMFPAIGIYSLTELNDNSWSMTEFRNDAFAWIVALTNIIVISYFIFNSIRHPGLYGQQESEITKATSAGSIFTTSRAPAANGLQITIPFNESTESGMHVLDNSGHAAVQFSVTDFDSSKDGSMHKDLGDDAEKLEEKW